MGEPIHQSTAKYASDCLALYRAKVIDGVADDNAHAQLGTAVHAAIEFAFRATATGNREPLECALEGLDEWWAQRDKSIAPPWVYAEAERLLRVAYGEDSRIWLMLPGRGQRMAVEQEWRLDEDFRPVKPGEPTAYEGRFDIVQWGDKGLRVRDIKTTYAMPSNESIATDEQARVYSLAALALFPDAQEVTFELLMVRHGYTAKHTFQRGEGWETQTKRWLRAVRSAVAAAHEADEWPETPGAGCHWCPVSEKCAALSALKAQGSVPDDLAPESAARAYLALKGHVAKYERIARAAAEDAPIPVGIGKVLGYKPGTRKKWKYGVADLLAQLRADGATDDDLRAWFPGPSIGKPAMEAAALLLLKRGELDSDPHEYVDMLREAEPSATFTTYPLDSEK